MSVQLNILCLICSIFIRNTVKQGRCKTHMVSPDKIEHVRSKVSAERMLKGRKHLSQSVMLWFLSLFQNLFVQPGATTNSVYYYENVLEQGLLPAIRRISNNDFVFKQDGAPCTAFTILSLTFIPMCLSSLNQKNWPPNSPDLNPVHYSVWTVL